MSQSPSSLPTGKSSPPEVFDLRDKIRNKQLGVKVDVCGEVGDGEEVSEEGSIPYRFNPVDNQGQQQKTYNNIHHLFVVLLIYDS